jgi:hypothetical protein
MVLVLFMVACAPVRADDATKPYDYRIILRVAPHRLLTETFRHRLRDELQDGVQAALGPLARVSVIESPDAWLDLATLDTHLEIGLAKRHFVDIAFAGGQYVVRARQLDGSTGMAGPVVREAKTADRAFVGRLITRFIEQDFGPVGTVSDYDKASDTALLAFRGGAAAPIELARLVPIGSVFAISRLEGSRGRQVDSAYLVTTAPPADGRCECRVVYRYDNPLAGLPSTTYRAIKLGTGQRPVRLRLVDQTGLPAPAVQVRVTSEGFKADNVRDQGAVRDGTFVTEHSYNGIAYVLVTSGARRVAQIPVPVIDDRVNTCRVNIAPGGEARQQLELDARNLNLRLLDILCRLGEQSIRLRSLADTKKHAEALNDVTAALKLLDDELPALKDDAARLRREAGKIESSAPSLLDQCDLFVREIRKRRDSLTQNERDLQAAIDDEKKQLPQRDNFIALRNKVRAHLEVAEFDEALKTYDEMLSKFGDREDVRKEKETLEAKWKLKDDEHAKAREFIYGPWADMKTVDDIRANLPKARDAFAVCKRDDDRLTPRKLLLVSTNAAEIIAKAEAEINKESDSDRLNLKPLHQLTGDLSAFIKDVHAYLEAVDK